MDFREISRQLFKLFVANPRVHAEQREDGKYYTIYKPINSAFINRMLKQKESYLTYQFFENQIKWICLDFDISKEKQETQEYSQNRTQYFNELLVNVGKVSEFLNSQKIEYLAEFSGNRGIHLWIIFDNLIPRYIGFQILISILEKSQLSLESSSIQIDKFPKKPTSKAKLGYGVKLPLSLHKKSKAYSYFIENIFDFHYEDRVWIRELEEDFIENQLKILTAYSLQSEADILQKLELSIGEYEEGKRDKYIQTKRFIVDDELTLDTIIAVLSECSILKVLFDKHAKGENLSEKDRAIIVGLLNRLKTEDNEHFGKDILFEFFSRLPNFKENLTKKKLKNLNLYPIKCSYLKECYETCTCTCDLQDDFLHSPLDLMSDVTYFNEDIFDISKEEIINIAQAQIKYTQQNDEIALFPIIKALENLEPAKLQAQCLYHLDHKKKLEDFYTFQRKESDGIRELISLHAEDKILTTYFIKIVDSLFHTEFSNNSYGYRFENSLTNDYIFRPWLQQWNIYTHKLEEKIKDEDLSDYTLIKIDLKSFYSSIDLERLKVKLFDGRGKTKILQLGEHDRERYFNICDTLIEFCSTISGTSQGVPQGPAFARYLAELYLMEFDQSIEKQLKPNEFYFRYVDDIFIFIEDKGNAIKLDKQVYGILQTHHLERNDEKYFFGSVKDYRENFHEYCNKTKYFVDQLSKNIRNISNEQTKKAINALYELLKTGESFSINNDNLSFFLTHFPENEFILEKKKELIEHNLCLEVGRGSLFRNFFNFYFSLVRKEDLKFDERVLSFTGLKREVFCNSLLSEIYEKELTDHEIVNLQKLLNVFVQDRYLSQIEEELLLTIMLVHQALFNENFWEHVDEKIRSKVLSYKMIKHIPDKIGETLLHGLIRKDINTFIDEVYNIIFFNNISSRIISKFGELFFNRIHEILLSNLNLALNR